MNCNLRAGTALFLHSALTSTKIGRHDAPLVIFAAVGYSLSLWWLHIQIKLDQHAQHSFLHLTFCLAKWDKASGPSRMVNFLGSRPIFFKSYINKHRRSHSADFCRGAISLFFCCNFALFLPDFFGRSPTPVVQIGFVNRYQSGRSFCLIIAWPLFLPLTLM